MRNKQKATKQEEIEQEESEQETRSYRSRSLQVPATGYQKLKPLEFSSSSTGGQEQESSSFSNRGPEATAAVVFKF